MTFLPGLELSRRLHDEVVAPVLARRFPGLRYAAARVDSGSELLGFDSPRSADHDWGARLQVFVPRREAAPAVARALEAELPDSVAGHPARFRAFGALGVMDAAGDRHGLTVLPLADFMTARLGRDPRDGWTVTDWLATPTQRLAELTGGAVYADTDGGLTAVRRRLAWYPDDVWRHVLACQWHRVDQEEPFPGRCREVGDELGARVVEARLARDLMRLCLLLARRWPPYSKWLGSAFAALPCIGPVRDALLAGDVGTASVLVAGRSNASGLHAPLDAALRPFHDRPFPVLAADRFAEALRAAVTDPEVRALPLVGAVDQVVDNVDALGHPARTRGLFPNDR
ncbi:DUF4037 domain-containing protein [Spirilliplanes yamanashiensis]|uniref:DUF4037 domain-containing protein n=1 Tax=Spirilliplanes yamanashiensis TaxID=42233 RepID=A0A8J3Y9W2_9ACTN|nr:DUF4037 domain-containing protein [Spirilliplanes yamanashiensis]MDP9817871.1 hypothetical protein [Spirilliplanes yamanashiensis]GIJ04681.1 hypothetical protein Sya03_40330 [Spirilliplanes yamanashiensis]